MHKIKRFSLAEIFLWCFIAPLITLFSFSVLKSINFIIKENDSMRKNIAMFENIEFLAEEMASASNVKKYEDSGVVYYEFISNYKMFAIHPDLFSSTMLVFVENGNLIMKEIFRDERYNTVKNTQRVIAEKVESLEFDFIYLDRQVLNSPKSTYESDGSDLLGVSMVIRGENNSIIAVKSIDMSVRRRAPGLCNIYYIRNKDQ